MSMHRLIDEYRQTESYAVGYKYPYQKELPPHCQDAPFRFGQQERRDEIEPRSEP